MYDYTIIGAGPTGLTLAYYLAKYNKKILLIDKQNTLGGCHRVIRVNDLFTEHGPRIYINNYFSLIDILSDMGHSFYDLFTPYNFSMIKTINKTSTKLSINEYMAFVYEYIKFIINDEKSKKVTMIDFAKSYNFNDESIRLIDNLCRLTDGGTIYNYTLYEFLQIPNQNILYTIYQPKYPNDIGLFKIWKDALEKTNNVDFMLNTEIYKIVSSSDKVTSIITKDGKTIDSSNFIFAIPPKSMIPIIKKSDNTNIFGDYDNLEKWSESTQYFVYIPIIFHWDTKLELENIWGLTDTDYSLVNIVMSDYMNFDNPESKTVITCTVKNADRISSYNNKTANECNEKELIEEVFRQLKLSRPNLPPPTKSLLSPEMFKNNQTNKWDSTDSAFFYTKDGYKSNKSIYDNLFWVGTHNGNSHYAFTSMESAMQNAIYLLHELEPDTINKVKLNKPITTKWPIVIIILLIIIIIIYKLIV